MTIDLGFAWFDLPGGEAVGVVDVPGHRDFIENMLAGVGGIDAALFVVAADEGVMPQTREHLAILDLLQVPGGVVALTKTDLAESEDWIGLVTLDVAAALRGTVLEHAPIVPVSARRGAGLDDLRAALQECLGQAPRRANLGRPRLPIDRVFTMSGFGAVVTGTLVDGELAVGGEVEVQPGGQQARIRGLQSHKEQRERIPPGSRAAVNLTGVDAADLRRGDVLGLPGLLTPTRLMDVRYRHLPDATHPLKHNAEVKVFVGAAEVMARVRLLSHESMPPGEAGWLQLALAEPLAAVKGDRYILRRPSPGATIGGGQVVDAHPTRKHRRKDARTLARLETALRGTPGNLLEQALDTLGPASLADAAERAGLDEGALAAALAELAAEGRIIRLDSDVPLEAGADAWVASPATWARITGEMVDALAAYHSAQPLRAGMSREELKSKMRLSARAFGQVAARAATQGLVVEAGPAVRLPTHEVHFNANEQARVEALLAACRAAPHGTPLVREARAQVGEAVYAALLEQGQLVQLNDDVFFLRETYDKMVEQVTAALAGGGTLTVAQVRDMFQASRKYALALMEHLDAQGITVRQGDDRVLRRRA